MTTPLKVTPGEAKRLERNLKDKKPTPRAGQVKVNRMDKNIIEKAYRIYQEKHGGSIVEISILFVNVTEALRKAAEEIQRGVRGEYPPDEEHS